MAMIPVDADTIVVGLDNSASAQEALGWAVDEAARSGRRLLIVHAWHWSNDALASPTSIVGMPDSHKSGRALLGRAAAGARQRDVPVTTRLVEGAPSRQLVTLAADAAMLVVGSHGHGPVGQMVLGSVSRGCVQHATCPVVVVPSHFQARQPQSLTEASQPGS